MKMGRSDKPKVFLKVLLIGNSGGGKTSLIQRFVSTQYSDSLKPTIGADFSNKELVIDG